MTISCHVIFIIMWLLKRKEVITMNYETVYLNSKTVVGLAARTKNTDPDMTAVIGSLWNDFYQNSIYASINNKVNDKALGIYSDYEADANGEYNITVACEVEKAEEIPPCTVAKVIPAGKYAKFLVRGHMQKAVAEFWQKLWAMDLNRAYTYDFEEYQDSNVDEATIYIYISIK